MTTMMINEKKINVLSSLISEGITTQKRTTESKKKYLAKVKNVLISMFNEDNVEIPYWLELLDVHVIYIGEDDNQIAPSFPDNYVIQTVQLLKDIRSEYYLEHQLQESHKQTRWTFLAFIVSLGALLATIINSCTCN